MSQIIKLIGKLENVNSFLLKNQSMSWETSLDNIFICPKSTHHSFEPSSQKTLSLQELYKIAEDGLGNNFSPPIVCPISVLFALYKVNALLTCYIYLNCYVFYKIGANSFEPIMDSIEIDDKLLTVAKDLAKKKDVDKMLWFHEPVRGKLAESVLEDVNKRRWRPECKIVMKKDIRCKKKRLKNIEKLKFQEIERNENDCLHGRFSLNKMLYDAKLRPNWPKNHVLSHNSVQLLLRYIYRKKITGQIRPRYALGMLIRDNYKIFANIFQKLLINHNKVCQNNGFGRILKKHLQKWKICSPLPAVPKTIVSSYVIDIFRRIVPLELFGSKKIRKKFFSQIILIINGRKHEKFIWLSLTKPFTSYSHEIKWCSEMDDEFCLKVLILKIVKFLVLDFLFVFVRACFFVSETGVSGYGLRYFRKPDILRVSDVGLRKLIDRKQLKKAVEKDFQIASVERKWLESGRITATDLILKGKKYMFKKNAFELTIAKSRWLPKDDGNPELRLITNSKRSHARPKTSNIGGSKLEKTYERRAKWRSGMIEKVKLLLELFVRKHGTGIKPLPNEPKLIEAWRKVSSMRKRGRVYFVKADISDAFGSIKHRKLKDILEKHFSTNWTGDIQLKKITEWRQKNGQIRKSNRVHFCELPKENTILIGRTENARNCRKLPKYSLNTLKEILYQVVFKEKLTINGKIYKRLRGVAQGSSGIFSSSLCEIYYSEFDKLYFAENLSSDNTVLLRGVDDYLLVTSDRERAERFYAVCLRGVSGFNVSFNANKLLTNLFDEKVLSFGYLGLIFNVSDLSVTPNYAKFERKSLISTVFLSDKSERIHFDKFRWLRKRVLNVNCLKIHPIIFEPGFNNRTTIKIVVFEAFVMQAVRVLVLSQYLFAGLETWRLRNVVSESLKKLRRRVSKSNCLKMEANFLYFYAFSLVFARYPSQFPCLLNWLRLKLSYAKQRFITDGLEPVLDELKADVRFEEGFKGMREVFQGLIKKSNRNWLKESQGV